MKHKITVIVEVENDGFNPSLKDGFTLTEGEALREVTEYFKIKNNQNVSLNGLTFKFSVGEVVKDGQIASDDFLRRN